MKYLGDGVHGLELALAPCGNDQMVLHVGGAPAPSFVTHRGAAADDVQHQMGDGEGPAAAARMAIERQVKAGRGGFRDRHGDGFGRVAADDLESIRAVERYQRVVDAPLVGRIGPVQKIVDTGVDQVDASGYATGGKVVDLVFARTSRIRIRRRRNRGHARGLDQHFERRPRAAIEYRAGEHPADGRLTHARTP